MNVFLNLKPKSWVFTELICKTLWPCKCQGLNNCLHHGPHLGLHDCAQLFSRPSAGMPFTNSGILPLFMPPAGCHEAQPVLTS